MSKGFVPSESQSLQGKNSDNHNDGDANDNSNNFCLITLLWGLRNISETRSAIMSASESCYFFSCLFIVGANMAAPVDLQNLLRLFRLTNLHAKHPWSGI